VEKKNIDFIKENSDEELDWEAFFVEENPQEWEKEKSKRRKRKKWFVKIVSSLLVFSLLISGLQIWFNLFNIPAIRFMEVSNRLSKEPNVRAYKESVVTIEWDGVKGTGFNIAADGLIVTNAHVVGNSNRVNVHFRKGDSYPGKVIAKDPDHDLALVDIEANNLSKLPLEFEKQWEKWIDKKILFIGNPLAFTQIANEGTVTGKALLDGWDVPVMMIEAPIYRGNSGSPVINDRGGVIGVIFATLKDPAISSKNIVGAAIPSYYIQPLLAQVKKAP